MKYSAHLLILAAFLSLSGFSCKTDTLDVGIQVKSRRRPNPGPTGGGWEVR